MDLESLRDLLPALARGAVSATAVAALLAAARRWGGAVAGLLAGLPTITAPALAWLALDRGAAFAAQAAYGAVAAGAACALFALAYARLAPRCGRLPCLVAGAGASVPLLGLAHAAALPLPALLIATMLVCAVCLRLQPRPGVPAAAAAPAWLWTALAAGAVTALASAAAQGLGPEATGWLTSPPLLAAVIAADLHRPGVAQPVREFLRGYTAGLAARSVFVAAFGALVVPAGLWAALALAALAALLLLRLPRLQP